MLGLDERIAELGGGDALGMVIAVAALIGLRHATDPDHLTAVSTLVATDGHQGGTRRAALLGAAWGVGHAVTLVAFGLPIVLFGAFLPAALQTAAEAAVGALIVALALRLLLHWRRGSFHAHEQRHDGNGHRPVDRRNAGSPRDVSGARMGRSPAQAFGIGLLHGMGGSAGVGLLLLAAAPGHLTGIAALVVLALFSAVSMAGASTSLGWALSRGPLLRSYRALAPALGVASAALGTWYLLGAFGAAPYIF